MQVVRVLIAVLTVALFVGVGACKKGGGDKKDSKGGDMSTMGGMDNMGGMDDMGGGGGGKPKLSHKDNPKVGDSCKGLSASDGRLACDGNIKIFCSSMSKYKWKKLGECKGGTKCTVAANGKSASCK